jgi:hypothetical protein
MDAQTILAIMLLLLSPGRSIYSVVPVEKDSPPGCEEKMSLLCQRPHWNDAWNSWVRAETYDEGLRRWWTIAQALEQTAGADASLTQLALTVTMHESGWRRDVHSGIGDYARGDQDRSWCLGQILLGTTGREKVAEGWRARQLVGTGIEPTKRCLTVVTRALRDARGYCGAYTRQGHYCTIGVYGGVNDPVAHPGVRLRISVLKKIQGFGRPQLSAEVRQKLGLPPAAPPAAPDKP